jgi:tetratricopeptide (TPR) repeat protein
LSDRPSRIELSAPSGGTSEEAYDAALERAFAVAREHNHHLQSQKTQAKRMLKKLEHGGLEAAEKLPVKGDGLAKYQALRERSWSLRFEDPDLMVQFARLAAQRADQLDVHRYGRRIVDDYRCEAQAELGNALRVAEELDQAEASFMKARELFELGTQNPLLEMRILELEATLDADRRRFGEAISRLERVFRYYRRHHQNTLAGRALLKQGIYTTYAGDPEAALKILQSSLALIDSRTEPALAYDALHNQVWILVDCGRFHEAEKQLFLLRAYQVYSSGRITQIRVRWLEGRIDAGLKRFDRAERTLYGVREDFMKAHRAYDAALASLDLAAVLLAQRKSSETVELVTAAYKTFVGLRIERETLAALVLLRTLCEVGRATQAMAEAVASFFRRFDSDQTLKFQGFGASAEP